jgi:hypothetical protein
MLFTTDQLIIVHAERVIEGPNTAKAWPDVDAASSLHSQALALLGLAADGGQIFVPRQQILVHRPRYVGQDARPIHIRPLP